MVGSVDNCSGAGLGKFGGSAESPRHADRVDTGAASGLNVDAGVADVDDLRFSYGCFADYFEYDRWVGLYGDAVALTADSQEVDVGEEVPNEFRGLGSGVCGFVAANGEEFRFLYG